MRYYGALRKHIPLTFWAMMIGTLAITGVGIYWLHAGFAGFHSKDAIIEAAYASGTEAGGIAFAVAVFAALLTSFYSWRLMFLTFFGKARWDQSEHIQHAMHDGHHHGDHGNDDHAHDDHHHAPSDGTLGYHPHESPIAMLIPLGLLSLGAIFAGYAFTHSFIGAEHGADFWKGSLAFDEHLMHAMHEVPLLVKLSASIVMLMGLGLAWWAYIKDTSIPGRFVGQFSGLYQFLLNKWYWDELYNLIFVKPSFWFGKLFWKGGDQGVIDRFGPNGAAGVVQLSSRWAAKLQTGYLYSYALVMLLGLAGIATWAMTR